MFRFWRKKKAASPLAGGQPLSHEEGQRLLAETLVSGKSVNLIITRGQECGPADSRLSRVAETDLHGRLALCQTMPPLAAINIGKPVTVTFLAKGVPGHGEQWVRVGYDTTLLEVLGPMEEPSASREGLLVVERPQTLSVSNLRCSPRRDAHNGQVCLIRESDGAELPILDLSEGGARFKLHPTECQREIGSQFGLRLVRGEHSLLLTGAVVIRCQEGQAAVNFQGLSDKDQELLALILQALPRDCTSS